MALVGGSRRPGASWKILQVGRGWGEGTGAAGEGAGTRPKVVEEKRARKGKS